MSDTTLTQEEIELDRKEAKGFRRQWFTLIFVLPVLAATVLVGVFAAGVYFGII